MRVSVIDACQLHLAVGTSRPTKEVNHTSPQGIAPVKQRRASHLPSGRDSRVDNTVLYSQLGQPHIVIQCQLIKDAIPIAVDRFRAQ
jgi:hypothetical protein